jgi:DNA polymerase III delta subunit
MEATAALDFSAKDVRLGQNFLLVGSDAYLTDLVSDLIRARIRDLAAADLVIIYGDEVKAAELNDLLDTYSIFSSAKLVLLRNAHLLLKAELDILAAYFENPSELQTLVVTAEKIDARVAGWKKIRDACQTVACDPPRYSGQLQPWLQRTLAKLGKTMNAVAAETFINRVELDYANANNELQKLALLAGDNKQITEEDVLRSIGFSRAGTQADFHRALGGRQVAPALDLLEKMLSSDWASLQVLFIINRFYMHIYHILLLKKNHISNAEINKNHLGDLFPKQRGEFLQFAENYTLRDMPRIFDILLDTDSKIKTTAASDPVLLTNCVLRLLEKA